MKNKNLFVANKILRDIANANEDITMIASLLTNDKDYLLKLINEMIEIFTKAKEELEKEHSRRLEN